MIFLYCLYFYWITKSNQWHGTFRKRVPTQIQAPVLYWHPRSDSGAHISARKVDNSPMWTVILGPNRLVGSDNGAVNQCVVHLSNIICTCMPFSVYFWNLVTKWGQTWYRYTAGHCKKLQGFQECKGTMWVNFVFSLELTGLQLVAGHHFFLSARPKFSEVAWKMCQNYQVGRPFTWNKYCV